MKLNLSLFLIILFFIPSLACGSFTTNSVVGSGDIIDQTIDVDPFSRVTLEGFGDVYVEQGQTETLSIQTDDNIIPMLDIRVKGDELLLGVKRGVDVKPSRSIIYHLTVQDLDNIVLAGSGTFDVGPVKSGNLTLSIPGSGDIKVKGITADNLSIDLDGSGNITVDDVNVKTVNASAQGSGEIKLEGKASAQNVKVGGSGNYLAGNLETTLTDISIPGSANITVWVKDELKIKVNGSGDIQYYGKPVIDQSGFGSGDIVSLGEK